MSAIKLAFSPCPNDTFVFAPMVQGLIDTDGLQFDYRIEDVEKMNLLAMEGGLDMAKVSFHAFLHLSPTYELMGSGSALGFGNGPLVISKKDYSLRHLDHLTVAIPGEYTTANLLLKIFAPEIKHKKILVFNEIEDAILKGEVDAGVIIHESRFTYYRKGLQLVADLGKMYEDFTFCPIPLGGIVALKKLGDVTLNKLNQVMHRSVEYAMNHPAESMDFVRSNAQELDDEVIKKHIRLYVNSYTLDLGPDGRLAIEKLFEMARKREVINP